MMFLVQLLRGRLIRNVSFFNGIPVSVDVDIPMKNNFSISYHNNSRIF